MKKANDFLEEIQLCMKSKKTIQDCYIPVNHPAKNLDEYMKEQYFAILFKALAETDNIQESAMSYIIYISEKAEFQIVPKEIAKYVFTLDDKKMQDCMISFRDEEIRYLLGFELYIISEVLENGKKLSYCENIWNGLEITENDRNCYQQIVKVMETKDFSNYSQKEYYGHHDIISGYLDKLDFSSERCLIYANFPQSKDYSLGGFFEFVRALAPEISFTWKKINDFEYVEKGELVSQFDSYQSEFFNAVQCTQIVADKSGIVLFMSVKDDSGKNIHISKWCGNGEPFGVIFHPLDNQKSVLTYLVSEIAKNKGLDRTITLRIPR